ncbi:trypsin-like serine peptidase [Streptomyces orinoci]|uniref:Serine protease n=1 Tax=Streptomyces orinoci TaxID=67339 RepID=A0ABV3K801_STRON|nr:serine protease [Streptomyces orinoci]
MRPRLCPRLLCALLLLLPLTGCSPDGATHSAARPSLGARTVPPTAPPSWSRERLAHARALGHHPGVSHTARATLSNSRVGALFSHDTSGDHFCTASVVSSPGKSLLITAAHCVHGGAGGDYKRDIVFVPAYRDGRSPDGIWQPAALVVDPRWTRSGDPDADVAFIVLKPLGGKRIADVLGTNRLGIDPGFGHDVRITGYPDSGNEPITCGNHISEQSAHQMRIACTGYSGGTSGSPWVTDFDPATRNGSVIGVIGGYQKGGDSDDVSYSPYFDDAVRKLYDQAVAQQG